VPSIKTSAVRGVSSADILRIRGVLHMRTSALFGAKNFGFFRNLWCVRTDKVGGGVEPVRTFLERERGSIFRDFVRTSFMGGSLKLCHHFHVSIITPFLSLWSIS